MDDTDDDARYSPNIYPANYHQTLPSSHRPKLPVRHSSYTPPIGNNYRHQEQQEQQQDDDDEIEEEEENNGARKVLVVSNDDDDEDDGENNNEHDENDDDDEEEEEEYGEDGHHWRRTEAEAGDEADEDSDRYRKKKKLKNLAFSYEFAPRVATPSAIVASAPKPSSIGGGGSGRNSPADWSEYATFVLLEAWGNRYVELGRKSLRSEEWHGVAKKVSQATKIVRTEAQCRNKLDTLKKKYKKEKMRLTETGGGGGSKWIYFKKMDALLTPMRKQQHRMSFGVDSGEYVLMKNKGYLDGSNGLDDEMKDSPGNSGSLEHDEDDSDGLPPKRTRAEKKENNGSSIRLLADSIQKFGEIYEKIENNKREQMLELEKMRMEFQRDIESQKRLIIERARAEIVKIRQGYDDENDASTENFSG